LFKSRIGWRDEVWVVAGGDPGPGGRYGGSGGVLGFTSENPSDSVEELRSSPASGLLTLSILILVVRRFSAENLLFLKVLTNLSDSDEPLARRRILRIQSKTVSLRWNEQTKTVFWTRFVAMVGLVLARVVDPVTAK